jgi:hypothetical protein
MITMRNSPKTPARANPCLRTAPKSIIEEASTIRWYSTVLFSTHHGWSDEMIFTTEFPDGVPDDLKELAEWYETNHITQEAQEDDSIPPDPDPDLEDNPEEDDPED